MAAPERSDQVGSEDPDGPVNSKWTALGERISAESPSTSNSAPPRALKISRDALTSGDWVAKYCIQRAELKELVEEAFDLTVKLTMNDNEDKEKFFDK